MTLKEKKKLFYALFLAGIVAIILGLMISYHQSKYNLTTTNYQIEVDNLNNSIRVVQLSDLHNSVFGDNNERLISTVRDENPDIILITGDLVNSHDNSGTDNAVSLLRELNSIAPTYISLGNQEIALQEDGIDIENIYEETGAIVLEYEYVDIIVKAQEIRIGGIYSFGIPSPRLTKEYTNTEDFSWMQEFQDTDRYKILLFHIPNYWLFYDSLYDWDVDIVFSGHVHGGQIRIPFIGGVWAPDCGWFPGKLCGTYSTEESCWRKLRDELLTMYEKRGYDSSYYVSHDIYAPSTLVLSRGLGNTDSIPRINNIPEIVVIDLK